MLDTNHYSMPCFYAWAFAAVIRWGTIELGGDEGGETSKVEHGEHFGRTFSPLDHTTAPLLLGYAEHIARARLLLVRNL